MMQADGRFTNHKRVYGVMKVHGLLLQSHAGGVMLFLEPPRNGGSHRLPGAASFRPCHRIARKLVDEHDALRPLVFRQPGSQGLDDRELVERASISRDDGRGHALPELACGKPTTADPMESSRSPSRCPWGTPQPSGEASALAAIEGGR